MYLHIGKEYVINNNDIIGIFNLEYIQNTKEYKKMYEQLESENSIKKLSTGLFTFENIFTKELMQGGAILLFISCNSRKIYE